MVEALAGFDNGLGSFEGVGKAICEIEGTLVSILNSLLLEVKV